MKRRGLVWMPEAAFNAEPSGFVGSVCFKLERLQAVPLFQQQRPFC